MSPSVKKRWKKIKKEHPYDAPLFCPFVHCHIRKSIRFLIEFSADVNVLYFPRPISEELLNFRKNDFQLWIFDLKISGELFNNKITIHAELYLSRSELDSATDPMKRSLVFCLIIGRNTQVLMSPFQRLSIFIRDKNPDSRRTRIEARSTVGVNEEFHNNKF